MKADFHGGSCQHSAISNQLSAVGSLLGCQNKRRLYPRVGGKQTAPMKSCGSVSAAYRDFEGIEFPAVTVAARKPYR